MVINKSSKRNRGQVHTVEAVAAAILILTGVIFAQSVTAVTPMTASTASQHSENQQGELAKGFATIMNDDETLKKSLLYWNNSKGEYHNTQDGAIYYIVDTPKSKFGEAADDHFISKGLGLRVDLLYYERDASGNLSRTDIPYMDYGTSSNHAYTTTTTIALYDSDRLVNADGSRSSIALEDGSSTFFMEDMDNDSELYNIVEVRITIWRI